MSDDKRRVPCEVYSRIVGYLRPVQDWNEGKRQEFVDRQSYGLLKAASAMAAMPGGCEIETVTPEGKFH